MNCTRANYYVRTKWKTWFTVADLASRSCRHHCYADGFNMGIDFRGGSELPSQVPNTDPAIGEGRFEVIPTEATATNIAGGAVRFRQQSCPMNRLLKLPKSTTGYE